MSLRRLRPRLQAAVACAAFACATAATATAGARLDPAFQGARDGAPVRAVVTFRGEGPPDAGELALLGGRGLDGRPFRALPMAIVEAPVGQLRQLASVPQVRSIWHDRKLPRPAPGPASPALPVSGGWSGRGIGVLLATPGADPGDGVHRLAPGAEVVGFRTGSGKSLSTALGAFDHALEHQFEHNIRVLWNPLAVLDAPVRADPDHPLQVALRALAERGVMVVVPQAVDADGSAVPWALGTGPSRDGEAPPLCGVLALMLEANPALDWRQARDILRHGGHPPMAAIDPDAAVRAALARAGSTNPGGRGQAGRRTGFGAESQ